MVRLQQLDLSPTLVLDAVVKESENGVLTARIPIRLMGKPRMTKKDHWERRPVTDRYWTQCDLLRFPFGLTRFHKFQSALRLDMTVYFKTPQKSQWGQPHREMPDIDNIWKGVADALFMDDKGIAFCNCAKYWSDVDAVELLIEGVER